jgi:hypothetical protein
MSVITVDEWQAALSGMGEAPPRAALTKPVTAGCIYRPRNCSTFRWQCHDNGTKRVISLGTRDRDEALRIVTEYRDWLNRRNGATRTKSRSRGLRVFSRSQLRERVVRALHSNPSEWRTGLQLRDEVRGNKELLYLVLKELVADGTVEMFGDGVRHSPWMFRLAGSNGS